LIWLWVSGWLAVSLVAAAAWRWLTPFARGLVEGYERDLAGDVTLAGIELLVGVIAGIFVLARPGRHAAARLVAAVFGAAASSLVIWGAGRQLGAPILTVMAVLLLAPLAVSLVTVVGSLVMTLVLRDPYGD
jgi:hypothetical protein